MSDCILGITVCSYFFYCIVNYFLTNSEYILFYSVMKIGITADVHLRGKEETPERYNALEDIIRQLIEKDIENLIIAGDLFDKDFYNYADFDNLCKKYNQIKFYIIPGNHDAGINREMFSSKNIQVFTEPTLFPLSNLVFFFIPYTSKISMGETIEKYKPKLKQGGWILIGHGDYLSNRMRLNEYEKGIYMPLRRVDVEIYKPARVILGHTHKPAEIENVYSPGSPCPLDITETGKRRFLILDLDTMKLDSIFIHSDYIYFDEVITVIPVEDESEYIQNQLSKIVQRWHLGRDEKKKVKIRIKVQGVTSNKSILSKIVKDALWDIELYAEPDIDSVKVIDKSSDRIYILNRIRENVERLKWKKLAQEREKILIKAAETIFLE